MLFRRTCTCLCAALKSMLAPMKAPGVSSGCGQRQVRCHWQAQALWQMASGIHLAHGAVQDKARLFPFCENDI